MLMPSIFRENLFDDFFNDFARPSRAVMRYNAPVNNVMRTDIKETDAGYELDIDLPGYRKEDVQAELKDGYLTISAAVMKDDNGSGGTGKDTKETFLRRERYCGACSRCFYVGEEVEPEDIRARFEDGILKVSVPKKEPKAEVEESRHIAIEG